jgi:hypothetical protein
MAHEVNGWANIISEKLNSPNMSSKRSVSLSSAMVVRSIDYFAPEHNSHLRRRLQSQFPQHFDFGMYLCSISDILLP